MEQEIKIKGEIAGDPDVCKFTVDRPVYAGGSAYFGSRELTQQSPLAKRLFEIPQIESVLIAGDHVIVSKSGYETWQTFGKLIGAKIREHLATGGEAVSEEFRRGLPSEEDLRKRVRQVLDDEINPAVAMHGGYVDLVDVKNNSIYIQFQGGCHGCASASMTLKMGIEKAIRQHLPEIGEILDATDHASGANPYY